MVLDQRPLLWLHWGAESRRYGMYLVEEYNDDQGTTTWSSPKQWNLSCALHAGLQVAPNNTLPLFPERRRLACENFKV
jgi:hypothetical protein